MKTIVSVDLIQSALRSEELRDTPIDELRSDARDYERFLLLAAEHSGVALAPTKRIDRMWHLHMQHPVAYFADCTRLFGEILDHNGGFGGTPGEAPVLRELFAQTSALWEAKFGEPYAGTGVKCTRNCVNRCQRRCSSRVSA
jgi:hypothetical protein